MPGLLQIPKRPGYVPGLFYVFFRIVIDLGSYNNHCSGFFGGYVFWYVLCIYINQKRSWSMGYGKSIFEKFAKVNNSRNLENGTGQILLLLLLVVFCGTFLRGKERRADNSLNTPQIEIRERIGDSAGTASIMGRPLDLVILSRRRRISLHGANDSADNHAGAWYNLPADRYLLSSSSLAALTEILRLHSG